MTIHTAKIGLVNVDATGNIVLKSSSTIAQIATSSTEHRILTDLTHAPNSANHPTLESYLTLEASAGFGLVHLDQTYVITQHA